MQRINKKISGYYSANGFNILTDYQIAKQDLLNELYTRKGEKRMDAEYGSILHQLIMEPLVAYNLDKIKYDITKIINKHIRFEVSDISVNGDNHTVTIRLQLIYKPTETAEQLLLNFTIEE